MRPEDLYPPAGGRPARRPIDVRSPGEVAKGALPGAVALPILDDDERHAVGLAYAREGQEAAVAVGERVTAPHLHARRAAWQAAADGEPSAFVCWRGGMRSDLARTLSERPDTPTVEGGYKAIRRHLMDGLAPSLARRTPFVVTGPTGSGKTDLLHRLAGRGGLLALDLEGAAEHRGSAFGAMGPQPAQATFEHRLALPLLLGREPFVLLEDESRNVGGVHLPAAVFDVVRSAPLVRLEVSDAARLHRIHAAYAAAPARREGVPAARAALAAAIRRLKRRLGGATTERMVAVLEDAEAQGAWFDAEAFRAVILPLLHDYYDPLYRKATPDEGRAVVVRGDEEEVASWIELRTREAA